MFELNRYVTSLIITSIVYASVVISAFYYFSKDDTFAKEMKTTKSQKMKFNFINPMDKKKKIVTEKKRIKKVEPIKKKIKKIKPVTKKIIKKKKMVPLVTKKIEKVIEPPKEEIKELEKVLEPIVKKEPCINAPSSQVEKKLKSKDVTDIVDEKNKKRNRFLSELRKRINENKSYPNSARRRGIQGYIEMSFNILNDGSVDNIEIVEGKSIFKKSARQAIERSFPINLERGLFELSESFKIKILYTLQ